MVVGGGEWFKGSCTTLSAGSPDVGKGDKGNDERQFATDRCTRIAIIQASVLEACNQPINDIHGPE